MCMHTYGQATQNDCSLALYTSPAWPVLDSPEPYSPELLYRAPVTRWWWFLSKGQWRQCPTTVFPGNWWANMMLILPITGNLPIPLGVKPAHHAPHLVGCCSRILLQTYTIPYPLNHWWLCQQLWFLSLVLRLGKHRPCRPVRGSPKKFSYSKCGGQSSASFGDLLQKQIWFRAWILKPSQGMWKIPRVFRLLCGCLRLHETQSWHCLHEILWFSELEHNN